jgi:hypothetical protein
MDAAHIKVDLRAVRGELRSSVERLEQKIDAKIDSRRGSLECAKRWLLWLSIALTVVMYAALAHGFGWI